MDSPKYNRTLHLPWSPGGTSDDKRATSVARLINVPIIVTEKIDGSNTSLEFDGCFARTHSGPPTHASFNGLKSLHATVKPFIPKGMQYFGEWVYAKHSIAYDALPNYFLMFGVRDAYVDGDRKWFEWQYVETAATLFSVATVPILWKGQVSSEKELKEITESLMPQPSLCGGIREGVVVRLEQGFSDDEFSQCIMKCVRANHVQTSEHWKNQEIIKNKLKV